MWYPAGGFEAAEEAVRDLAGASRQMVVPHPQSDELPPLPESLSYPDHYEVSAHYPSFPQASEWATSYHPLATHPEAGMYSAPIFASHAPSPSWSAGTDLYFSQQYRQQSYLQPGSASGLSGQTLSQTYVNPSDLQHLPPPSLSLDTSFIKNWLPTHEETEAFRQELPTIFLGEGLDHHSIPLRDTAPAGPQFSHAAWNAAPGSSSRTPGLPTTEQADEHQLTTNHATFRHPEYESNIPLPLMNRWAPEAKLSGELVAHFKQMTEFSASDFVDITATAEIHWNKFKTQYQNVFKTGGDVYVYNLSSGRVLVKYLEKSPLSEGTDFRRALTIWTIEQPPSGSSLVLRGVLGFNIKRELFASLKASTSRARYKVKNDTMESFRKFLEIQEAA